MINMLVHSSTLIGPQVEYRAAPAARASRDRVARDQHAAMAYALNFVQCLMDQ